MPTLNDEGLIEYGGDRVKLNPYKPRPLKPVEYLTDEELFKGAGGTLIGDTELFKNLYIVSFKCIKTNKYHVLKSPFDPRKLSWIMHNYLTIGFNWIKYDLPMIWYSYVTQDLRDLKQLNDALILEGLWHQQAQKEFDFKIWPTPHIDLIEVAPLKGSLKLYGARLHAPRLQEIPFPLDVELTPQQIEEAIHYNFNDLDTTHMLLDFMKERIQLRQAMSQEYRIDLNSKSDAQIAEAVLVKEVTQLSGKRPSTPLIPPGTSFKYTPPNYLVYQTPILQNLLERVKGATFVVADSGKVNIPVELTSAVSVGTGTYRLGNGGLHSSEKNVCYKATEELSIVDRDVTSYYPFLVMTLKLYPRGMGPEFLTAYDRIIQSRIRAKAAKRTTEANGKKIVVNGAGGKFSDPFSVLYDPILTIQQNVTGQLDLLLFIEILYLCGFTVISANTDGIVTLVPKDKETKYLECAKYWEAITGFNTEETRYSSYYARDVNSYFAVKAEAKSIKDIKVKGPYSEIGSQSGTQLDTNPTSQICTDAVKQLLLDGTPLEKTILECKDFTRFITVRQAKSPGAHKNGDYLGKVIRWAYIKGVTGTINYVATNNKIPDTEGAQPFMDLPEVFPDNIDYDWYIMKANEILTEINYYRKIQQERFF